MYSEFGSSSSAPFIDTASWTYDVFLSFTGGDKFTGVLYRNLLQRGIYTFMDNKLRRGEEISQELVQAIEGSRISLIVFSENYASSKWCLDELVHILECRRSKKQMVRPIYYKVDPSDVRNQRGKFGEAFAEHELRFNEDKVLRWRAALSEAAILSGWHISAGYEFESIDKIVEVISGQVKEHTYLDMPKYPVGIDSRVEDMLEILDVGGSDVHMVGIWGIDGIGKTTIAKAVYNTIAHKFDGSCFLANVREGSEQHGGLVNLQNILLSNIVGQKELKIYNIHEGIILLREKLRHKMILLVVDDVDNLDQLEKLAGRTDWCGHGSRVIITTRDRHLLIAHQVKSIYKVHELGHHEALELFSSNAFKDNKNLDDNEKLLVTTVVKYAQGIPLALEVLGSYLCDASIHKWQAMLDGFEKDPPKCIQDILTISYDGLQDTVKQVFLDIACFFKGRNTKDVIQILEGCERINPEHSVEVLEEKALIYVGRYGHICMHDLLVEMGKDKVLQESTVPGKRSRLWYHKDVQEVLTENTGTSKIEGITIKMPTADDIRLSPKCFKKMRNLKIFINVNGRFCGKVDYYPNQLRLLDWSDCPLQSLPSDFNMKNLVQLSMPCSRISRFGEAFKSMENLKSLNLKGCKFLAQSPDLSGSPNLEFLDLSYCKSLKKVHPSVGSLENLVNLNLEECSNLVRLPGKVNWRSLRSINLNYCTRLESFPEIVGEMKYMTSLRLWHTGIKGLPSSIGYLINLERLSLKNCGNLTDLPCSIYGLQNLGVFCLYKCPKLVTLPNKVDSEVLSTYSKISHDNFDSLKMEKPVELCLPGNCISRLGERFKSWRDLTSMSFESCEFIKIIPDISGLPNLKNLNLNDCTSLVGLDDSVGELNNLVDLSLSGCHNLITFPRRITLKSVKHINFKGCQMLESLPEIVHEMECLTLLDLSGTAIKELPSSIRYLRSLEELVLKECENLTNLPGNIYELQHLWCLDLQNCSKLVAFPEWSSVSHQINLKIAHNLWYLNLRGCKSLEEIPELPPKVEWINLADCLRLKRFAKLSNILVHKESEMIKCITMFNCQGLCDSLAIEIAENGNIVLNEVTLCSLFLSCKQSEFDIVFPGSEVPKWFSGRKDLMESIDKCEFFSFEIPPNFNLVNKGFAICAAAAAVENVNPEEKEIMQQCSFTATIDINAHRIVTRSFYFEAKDIELAHVWLCYIPFVKFVSRQSPPFTCGVKLEHTSQGSVRCKSYGVHLVIPQDEDEDEDDEDEEEEEEDGDEDGDGDGDEIDVEDGDEGKDQHEESVSKN